MLGMLRAGRGWLGRRIVSGGRRDSMRPRAAPTLELLEARQLLSVTSADESTTAPWFAADLKFEGPAATPATKEHPLDPAWALAVATSQSPQWHSADNAWLVQLSPGTSTDALAASPDVLGITPAANLADAYEIRLAPTVPLEVAFDRWSKLDGLIAAEPLVPHQQTPRFVPNDPLFANQWHLNNTGQSGGTAGQDAHLVTAWDSAQGAGVVIGLVDDGLQYTHPDLAPNYLASASFDFNGGDSDPAPTSADSHGTSAAGVAAARGNNATGVSGAAPQASLAGLRLIAAPATDSQEAQALSYQSNTIDIYSNSWGPTDDGARLEGPGTLTTAALAAGAQSGRGGLGNIYVWAAGNGLASDDNANYDGYANNRHVIAVSAIDHNGVQSSYSEPGANVLVAAYSSGGAVGITTTDLLGSSGYSSTDYTSSFGGTSSAAPLVAGVAALVLDENPNLSARDVQHILVQTAQKNDPSDSGWTTNGAGRWVSHKYGFGAIDATAAVAAAATWTNVGPETSYSSPTTNVSQTIPDNNTTGLTSSINVASAITIERAEVVFNATHPYRGDLEVVLTSPDGTQSILAEPHADSGDNYSSWTFSSVHHWGEDSQGTWTLRVRDLAASDVGTWNSWQLKLYGTAASGPTAPTVINHTPTGTVSGPVSQVVVNFSQAMDTTSFAVASDLASFTGPGGSLLPSVTGFQWLDSDSLRIDFAAQTTPGSYSFSLGSQILAAVGGLPLNQNGNGTPGEPGDGYSGSFTVAAASGASISGAKWNDQDADGTWDAGEPPLANWRIFLDLDGDQTLDTQAKVDFAATGLPLALPDLTTTNSNLVVGGLPGSILDVDVSLSVNQTYDGDLDVFLVGPDNTRVELFTDVGGSGDNFTSTTLDDEAPTAITAGVAPFAGSYRPEGLLSAFDGRDANGTWRLEITDDASSDVGTLLSWSLRVTVAEPSQLTDVNGNYSFTGLPAGTYHVLEVQQNPWVQTYPLPPGGSVADPRELPELTTTASSAPAFVDGVPVDPAPAESGARDPRLNQSGPLIRLNNFRADPRFAGINGAGFSAAVLDTGIDVNHAFFGPDANANGVADRIVYQQDFADGDLDASDVNGHGSNVASIVGSQDATYSGMAPGANLIALKVFTNAGSGQFSYIESALQWVVANAVTYNIASVNMSLGDSANYASAVSLYGLGDELAALAALNVIVVTSAGNSFFNFSSAQGVAYPAADPNSLAVGAVWDGNNGGPFNWSSGAVDTTTGTDRVVSFSQRSSTLTDIFAPGAMITGANATGGTVAYAGTSQASPHIAGIAVLAQQLAMATLGRRLTPAEFTQLVRSSAVSVVDGDDENDNVTNTGLTFPRVDVLALGEAILALVPPAPSMGQHTVTLATGQSASGLNFGNHDPTATGTNSPPVLDPVADQVLTEGATLNLPLKGIDIDTDQTLTFSLGPGAPGGVTIDPQSGLLTWATTDNTAGPVPITVIVTDNGTPHLSDSQTFQVTVQSVAPTLGVTAPSDGYRGEPLAITLSPSDPAPADQAGTFTYEFDWDNNGSFESNQTGLAGAIATHQYFTTGVQTFQVRARDKDGVVGAPVSRSVSISDYVLRADPQNPSLTNLIWGGTQGIDALFVFNQPGGIRLFAQFENLQLVNKQATVPGVTGKVIAYGYGSADVLVAEFLINRAAELYGGDGDDVLVGGFLADRLDAGAGRDIVLGGTQSVDGADTLLGGEGSDLLWGNRGGDFLDGAAGDDLLLADAFQFADVPSAVFAIQAEWTSARPYATRVANLSGTGVGPRANGNTFLTPAGTVLADGAVDVAIGGTENDWILDELGQDLFNDPEGGEIQTDSSP